MIFKKFGGGVGVSNFKNITTHASNNDDGNNQYNDDNDNDNGNNICNDDGNNFNRGDNGKNTNNGNNNANDGNDANGDAFKIEKNVFNDIVKDDHD